MPRVQRRVGCLAGMASGALAIVEASRERGPGYVAVPLRVRIVTRGAGHPPIHVAVAVPVSLLIGEGPDAAVGVVRLVAQLRCPQRVVAFQRHPGNESGAQPVLKRMALPADT